MRHKKGMCPNWKYTVYVIVWFEELLQRLCDRYNIVCFLFNDEFKILKWGPNRLPTFQKMGSLE